LRSVEVLLRQIPQQARLAGTLLPDEHELGDFEAVQWVA
jgi:hypothetical protein